MKSPFALLLDDLTMATMERFGRPIARHWREDPAQPEGTDGRWMAWLETRPDEGVWLTHGTAGENALRRLLDKVRGGA